MTDDKSDSMYIIISGKMGVLAPRPNYRQVKAEDRNNNRIIQVSITEAKALKTTSSLKEANKGIFSDDKQNDAETNEREARETFDML